MTTSAPGPARPASLPFQDARACPPAALLSLFDALDALAPDLSLESIEQIRAAVASLPLTRADLGSAIMIDTGAYVRTLVRQTDEYQVLVMAWLPGQKSPIHDHAGSCCAVRVVSGRGVEQVFELTPDGAASPVGPPREYLPGTVACSVDSDIHSLGNAAKAPCSPDEILVTVHVYAPPLRPTRKYQLAPK